jgi:hypothetical protein
VYMNADEEIEVVCGHTQTAAINVTSSNAQGADGAFHVLAV